MEAGNIYMNDNSSKCSSLPHLCPVKKSTKDKNHIILFPAKSLKKKLSARFYCFMLTFDYLGFVSFPPFPIEFHLDIKISMSDNNIKPDHSSNVTGVNW